jgi:hypothetical protein
MNFWPALAEVGLSEVIFVVCLLLWLLCLISDSFLSVLSRT